MTSFKDSSQAFQPEIVKATRCSGSFHRSSLLVEHLVMIDAVAILIKTMVTNHPINLHWMKSLITSWPSRSVVFWFIYGKYIFYQQVFFYQNVYECINFIDSIYSNMRYMLVLFLRFLLRDGLIKLKFLVIHCL